MSRISRQNIQITFLLNRVFSTFCFVLHENCSIYQSINQLPKEYYLEKILLNFWKVLKNFKILTFFFCKLKIFNIGEVIMVNQYVN